MMSIDEAIDWCDKYYQTVSGSGLSYVAAPILDIKKLLSEKQDETSIDEIKNNYSMKFQAFCKTCEFMSVQMYYLQNQIEILKDENGRLNKELKSLKEKYADNEEILIRLISILRIIDGIIKESNEEI